MQYARQLDGVLDGSYEELIGLDTMSGPVFSIAARGTHHRKLVFKDWQSWKAYQDRFGSDFMASVISETDSMARTTTQLRIRPIATSAAR